MEIVVADATSNWRGRRVLVTGHTGFKGSWLSVWMQRLGAEVLGYSLRPPTEPSMYDVAGVGQGMQSVEGDIRDLEKIRSCVAQFNPEVVFHLAAQSLVRKSYSDPVDTYSTNVMGTVNLLEAVRTAGSVAAVVVVTSDKCYENQEWVWGYRETDPVGGHDPYSSSKGCTELVTSAYRQSFLSAGKRAAVASARAGNVIGGGDWAMDRLVPDFIRAIANKEAMRIRHPNAQRPWQHVLEPIEGYIRLAEQLISQNGQSYASGWNFGPADVDAIRVSELVAKLAAIWGDGAAFEIDAGEHPHEASFLKLDCSKARTKLSWQSKLRIDDSLKMTVDWHKAHLAGANMREITEQQIANYRASP